MGRHLEVGAEGKETDTSVRVREVGPDGGGVEGPRNPSEYDVGEGQSCSDSRTYLLEGQHAENKSPILTKND